MFPSEGAPYGQETEPAPAAWAAKRGPTEPRAVRGKGKRRKSYGFSFEFIQTNPGCAGACGVFAS